VARVLDPPGTLLGSQRVVFAAPLAVPAQAPGSARFDREVRELILRRARENKHSGSVRVVGAAYKLGITVSAALVGRARPEPASGGTGARRAFS
jgi:hypothetical protein